MNINGQLFIIDDQSMKNQHASLQVNEQSATINEDFMKPYEQSMIINEMHWKSKKKTKSMQIQ